MWHDVLLRFFAVVFLFPAINCDSVHFCSHDSDSSSSTCCER